MLNNVDLSLTIDKDDYEEQFEIYADKLGYLQRKLRDLEIPVIILFEGWHGSLRGTLVNRLLSALDPRGFKVYSASKTDCNYKEKPYFAPFWSELPPKGAFSLYNGSWYYRKLEKEVRSQSEKNKEKEDETSYEDINIFERQLTDDGYLIVQIFLHISQQKQKKNWEKLEKIYGKEWHKVTSDQEEPRAYDDYYSVYEKMFDATDKNNAVWHVVPAEDLRWAELKIFEVLFAEIESYLSKKEHVTKELYTHSAPDATNILSRVDLSVKVDKERYKEELKKYQKRLRTLQFDLYKHKIPAVVVFEGWDASGKGGAIQRLTSFLDPLGYQVIPIGVPNVVEKQYHYLWRFWQHLPKNGEITIFDRSWYGRVLVERVEGFAADSEWQRAYQEINETEEQWVRHGILLAKFWLQIDKDVQYQRFEERENNPDKEWKITEEDWRNREKWDQYEIAVNEMLYRTSTDYAPWTIVEANSKYHARLKVLATVVALFERALKNN